MVKKTKDVFIVAVIIFLIAFTYGIILQNIYGNSSFIIAQVSYYLILIFIIVFTVRKYQGKSLDSIGLSTNDLTKQILIGIGIFALLSLITIIPLLGGASKQEVLNFKPKNGSILIYFIFFDIFLVGVGEELIFRGYFLERINEVLGSKILAVLISSILFGLYHYPTKHDIIQVISATIFGIVFSIFKLKIKKCGLISLSIAHGLNDAFIILLGYFLL